MTDGDERLPEERRRQVVKRVTDRDGAAVRELAHEFDVSAATIRGDLRELADRGLIERTHGGAVPPTSLGDEPSLNQKEVVNREAKLAIAQAAVEQIQPGQIVFFDSGTTTMEVARKTTKDGSFMAVTNSPLIANELSKDEAKVRSTGGRIRPNTRAAVGPRTNAYLAESNFDVLFLGCRALHPTAGLTTPNEDEARVKQTVIEQSDWVVLVADESKFGERKFSKVGELADIDVLVTDAEPPSELRHALEEADVETVVAE